MGDKRFPATRLKREKARKSGDVPRSRIASSVIGLACSLGVLACCSQLIRTPVWLLRAGFAGVGDLIEQNGGDFHTNNMLVSAQEAVWVYGVAAVVPLVSIALVSMVQHRLLAALLGGGVSWSGARILPKFARLDPIGGLRRIFGPNGVGDQGSDSTAERGMSPTRMLSELLKSTALHVSAVAVLLSYCSGAWKRWQLIESIEALWAALHHEIGLLASTFLGCWALLAIADLVVERALHAKRLRMDLSELKRELRQNEGSPELRTLRRQLHQALLLHELVQGVRKAKILVVNGDRLR